MRQLAIIGFGLLVCATGYAVRLTDEGVMAFGKRWSSQRIVGTDLNDVVFNGSRFVAVGTGGLIATSDNATNWAIRESGTSEELKAVVWANGQFIVVGHGGVILTSPDGEIWIQQHTGDGISLQGVAYNDELYIAVGSKGTNSTSMPMILTSNDGVVWTEVSTPANLGSIADVLWIGDKFVVLAYDLYKKNFAWSSDGAEWFTVESTQPTYYLNSLVWNGNKLMATGVMNYAGAYGFSQFLSTNGLSWSDAKYQSNQYVHKVEANNGIFYALGTNTKAVEVPPGLPLGILGFDAIYHSTDGLAWTKVYNNRLYELRSFTWSDMYFVAVGKKGQIVTNQFSVGSIFPADGIADYLEGLGFYYDGFYPFVWSWDEESWLWVAADGASLEEGFYFWHFGLNNWCWSNQGFFPWYYEFDPEAGGYREFGSGEESNE